MGVWVCGCLCIITLGSFNLIGCLLPLSTTAELARQSGLESRETFRKHCEIVYVFAYLPFFVCAVHFRCSVVSVCVEQVMFSRLDVACSQECKVKQRLWPVGNIVVAKKRKKKRRRRKMKKVYGQKGEKVESLGD